MSQTTISSQCSSNIALVKYWGKFHPQLPANASISFTLSKSFTETFLSFEKSDNFSVEVFLGEENQPKFAEKIKKYFESIQEYLPFITAYSYVIKTQNSFPHSSGIASSASGFGAIAKCLIQMEMLLNNETQFNTQKASFLARLGSGSACRSLYNGLAVWGKHNEILGSSDEFAIAFPYEVHSEILNFCDSILLVHEGEKQVSSTVGHSLMNNHPFANERFVQANQNLSTLIPILKEGNLEAFGNIIESEALTLHAMMMTSNPYFILMQPNTVAIIHKIWEYRNDTKLPIFFTLDAGANVHVLYPRSIEFKAKNFISQELLKFTENRKVIEDFVKR